MHIKILINSLSGRIDSFTNSNLVKINSISGNQNICGSVVKLNSKSVSGNILYKLKITTNKKHEIRINSKSGNIKGKFLNGKSKPSLIPLLKPIFSVQREAKVKNTLIYFEIKTRCGKLRVR